MGNENLESIIKYYGDDFSYLDVIELLNLEYSHCIVINSGKLIATSGTFSEAVQYSGAGN